MKITKYFLSFAAALGMMTGCYKPEIVQMVAPEDVVPPVLESIDDMVYTLDNIGKDSLVFNWAPVEYGADVQIDYALEVCLPGEEKVSVVSGLTNTTHTDYYENLNTIIRYKLGVEPEEATELEFYVSAKFLDYAKVYSEPVKASVTTVDAPAPVLGTVEDIEITLENIEKGKTSLTWEPVVYGKRTVVTYSVEVALPDSDEKSSVVSGVKKATTDVAFKDLNGTLLYGLEIEPNKKTDVNFYIAASIGGVGKVYSEPVLASVEVTNAEKEYPKLYIVGSYNGWNHDAAANPNQFIFDFAEEDKVYQGLIDFGADHSANEFKITAGAWGNQEHSMASGTAEGLTTLVAGGGDNINTYQAKRYYHLTFDRTDATNITLNADFSFDHVGVVGSFNGWNEVDNVEMTFHPGKQRFYADVEFESDAEFKFNIDKTWEVSYGAGSDGNLTSNNGANIKAAAGNYRIYLNMNNKDKITYELNAAAYGTEEGAGVTPPAEDDPVEPEVPELKGWGIAGTITGWADGADIMMASDGKWYVAKGVEFGAEDKFKIRLDGKWETSFGGEFKANEEVVLTSENGPDIVPAAGTYDIYFDPETGKAWFINDGSYPGGEAAPVMSIYGVIGVNGDWDNDIMMYEADGIYVARKVEFTANGSFKVRKAGAWDDTANFGLEGGSGPVEVDHVYDVISAGNSGNLEIAAGTYDIWLDVENLKVYVMTPGKSISEAVGGEVVVPVDPSSFDWYLVGQFNNWATSSEAHKMAKSEDGKWFEFKGFAADGQGFKFHAAGENPWSVNRGAASEEEGDVTVTVGEPTAIVADGNNMILAAGTYDVYMNAACDKVYFMAEGEVPEEMVVKYTEYIYVPGAHQSWTPASAPALWSPEKNGVYTGFCYFNGEFKFTHARDWDNGEYNSTNFETYPEGFGTVAGNTNMSAPDGYYYVTVNVPEKKIEVLPVAWGVIGTATTGGWDADQDMTWNAEKKCWTATLALTEGELKFRSNDAWDTNPNLGGAFDNLTLGGGNINITEAGTYVMDLYTERTSSDKIYCTMTKQ